MFIAVCRETKRKFLFGTETEDGERERRIGVRLVSYPALGGALPNFRASFEVGMKRALGGLEK